MRSIIFIVLGVLMFGVLGARAARFLAPNVESELAAAVQLRLRDAGVPEDRVFIDGRDAWVSADLSGDASFERIEAALEGVKGLRRIRSRPEGVDATLNEAAFIEVAWSDDAMAVRGLLADRVGADEMLATLRTQFPQVTISDSIQIDSAGSSTRWQKTLPELVSLVRGSIPRGSVVIQGLNFVVRGTVEDENVRSEVGERLLAKLPGMTVTNQIEVPTEAGPVALAIAGIIGAHTIGFEHQSDQLTREAEDVLARVAVILEDHPDVTVRLEGFADNHGRPTTSFVLSRLKAEVVRDFLVRMGANANALVVRAMGEAERTPGDEREIAGRAQVRLVVDTE